MALAQGPFGIEYVSRPKGGDSSGIGWVVAIVVAAALVSTGIAIYCRYSPTGEELIDMESPQPVEAASVVSSPVERPPDTNAVPIKTIVVKSLKERPAAVRVLLMRLKEAERSHNMEMARATIEKLRGLPGAPAADLDDQLARQLGELNIARLFAGNDPSWVEEVTVKPGNRAARIAEEHGSTLASLVKLNSLAKPDLVRTGQRLKVMNCPKFTLVVHRATKIADLSLNGRFFRRYDLVSPVTSPAGSFETPARLRPFFADKGLVFAPDALSELELLIPAKAQLVISEL